MIITPIKQNLINLPEMSLLIILMAIPILIIIKIMEETKEIRIIYPKKKGKNFQLKQRMNGKLNLNILLTTDLMDII